MLKKLIGTKPSEIDQEITRVIAGMNNEDLGSDKYNDLMGHLDRLVQLQHQQRSSRVSPYTMAIVAGNLLGIVIIVTYERANVIVTRAMTMMLKTKLQ